MDMPKLPKMKKDKNGREYMPTATKQEIFDWFVYYCNESEYLEKALDKLISDSITAKPIDHEDTQRFKQDLIKSIKEEG